MTVSSAIAMKKSSLLEAINIEGCRCNDIDINTFLNKVNNFDYNVIETFIDIDDYCENVVTYMSGYVIKMLKHSIHCTLCLNLLISDNTEGANYLLIERRNLGAYLYPLKSLVTICKETEKIIRQLLYLHNNDLPLSSQLVQIIVTNVSSKLINNLNRIVFPGHEDHSFNLLKLSINCYCKIRLHNLSRKYTFLLQGQFVRKNV